MVAVTVSEHDPINHPAHYASHPSKIEAIEIAARLDFCFGNAFKYVFRAGAKTNAIEDLKKAQWYIDRASRNPRYRRPGYVNRKALSFLIYEIYHHEPDDYKAEVLLLICEAACCWGVRERQMKLAVAHSIIGDMQCSD